MTHFVKRLVLALALIATSSLPAFAVVLDFEGVVSSGHTTQLDNATVPLNAGFTVTVEHGHFYDSGYIADNSSDLPTNGTDWFYHDNPNALRIEKSGEVFSIQFFDATFRDLAFNGNTRLNHVIDVTGFLEGGGTLSTTFTVDDLAGFQTFAFDPSWTGLIAVEFANPHVNAPGLSSVSGGRMAYDNIVVDEAPLPAALPLFATGLGTLGMLVYRRKRRRAA